MAAYTSATLNLIQSFIYGSETSFAGASQSITQPEDASDDMCTSVEGEKSKAESEGYQVNSGPSEFGTKWTRDQVVNSGPNIFGTRWIRDQTLGEFGTKFFQSHKYVNTGISYLVWVPFPTYFIAPLWYASLCWICVCFVYLFPW